MHAPQLTGDDNRLRPADRAVHDWYRFVLSFPPASGAHLSRAFRSADRVEPRTRSLLRHRHHASSNAANLGFPVSALNAIRWPIWRPASKSIGHPIQRPRDACADGGESRFALGCTSTASTIRHNSALRSGSHAAFPGLAPVTPRTPPSSCSRTLSAIRPLHKALVLLEALEECRDEPFYRHERLALARSDRVRSQQSAFRPRSGSQTSRKPTPQSSSPGSRALGIMAADLESIDTPPDRSGRSAGRCARCRDSA